MSLVLVNNKADTLTLCPSNEPVSQIGWWLLQWKLTVPTILFVNKIAIQRFISVSWCLNTLPGKITTEYITTPMRILFYDKTCLKRILNNTVNRPRWKFDNIPSQFIRYTEDIVLRTKLAAARIWNAIFSRIVFTVHKLIKLYRLFRWT
jgi:hypothetical protein